MLLAYSAKPVNLFSSAPLNKEVVGNGVPGVVNAEQQQDPALSFFGRNSQTKTSTPPVASQVFKSACTYAGFIGSRRMTLPVASWRAAAIAGAASAFAASEPPP